MISDYTSNNNRGVLGVSPTFSLKNGINSATQTMQVNSFTNALKPHQRMK